MKNETLSVVLAAILGGVFAHECVPRIVKQPVPVPTIVTMYDTVHDTVRIKAPQLPVQPNTVLHVTLHTPTVIPVAADSTARSHLWPVLNIQVGKSRGDTSLVTTFSLRSGQAAVSRIWTPGPLRSVWADSTMTPRLVFGEPSLPQGVSVWTKLKWTSIGYGGRMLQDAIGLGRPVCR